MNSKQVVGDLGEQIAGDYLKDNGYKILAQNFNIKLESGPSFGEIDIVAEKHNIIRFIEVKTLRQAPFDFTQGRQGKLLSGDSNIGPEQRVDFQKQRKLKKLAQIWLNKNKIPFNKKWQIDVIGIKVDPDTEESKIEHFENAIECD